MTRRPVHARQLQAGIQRRALTRIAGERARVAGLETGPHGGTARRVIDNHKAPRLAQTHRRSRGSEVEDFVQHAGRQRLRPEPPHIAPPAEQSRQAIAEILVEHRDQGTSLAHSEYWMFLHWHLRGMRRVVTPAPRSRTVRACPLDCQTRTTPKPDVPDRHPPPMPLNKPSTPHSVTTDAAPSKSPV